MRTQSIKKFAIFLAISWMFFFCCGLLMDLLRQCLICKPTHSPFCECKRLQKWKNMHCFYIKHQVLCSVHYLLFYYNFTAVLHFKAKFIYSIGIWKILDDWRKTNTTFLYYRKLFDFKSIIQTTANAVSEHFVLATTKY